MKVLVGLGTGLLENSVLSDVMEFSECSMAVDIVPL